MGTSQKKNESDKPTPPPDRSTVLFLLGTMADTTWRMFIPIIGLAIGGVALDVNLATKPWFTIAGIIVGTGVAGLLVYRQIKRVKK
ncbi:MAG TPA: AtpZ/AtpI family protein [Candidatus Saccharibacteria bacterium]|mgnify:CR=1 FL=1|nr:AtpZ/AtpI family protein [Candidatus Saccharibacteria bacterium]HRQ06788.1 AtpZ/AtpI family protein [Candidatus Saccharibacteria bacterium]